MNNKSFGGSEALASTEDKAKRTPNGVMHLSATKTIEASMPLLVEYETNQAERKFA
jgi:hypothetical protein